MVETTNVFKRGVNRFNQELIERFERTQPEGTVFDLFTYKRINVRR